ncbi:MULTISPECIES: hypothetical protein [unclassified Pseudomonas]|uniref:hypothetical protein n=1 Tax=Pseudomonas lundensis TaxID=86185 RepID=UPI0015B4CD32|nr:MULTISPECIES: hypothetical protein [unclassified Pseudomonas]
MRTFDRIRDAVLPQYRERVAEYLTRYEDVLHDSHACPDAQRTAANQLMGYIRGLNTTRVLGMADLEELERRITESWLKQAELEGQEEKI